MIISSNFSNAYNETNPTISPVTAILNETLKKQAQQDTVEVSHYKEDSQRSQTIEKNIKSGIAYIETMGRGLEQGERIAEKLWKLAKRNESTDTSEIDKYGIQQQATDLFQELNTVFKETNFNGKKVFEKPSYSLYTGEQGAYKTQTENIEKIKENIQLEGKTKLLDNKVENQTGLHSFTFLASKQMAISAYQQSAQFMQTKEIFTSRNIFTTTMNEQAQKRKEIRHSLIKVFDSKKDANVFFEVKNQKELFNVLEAETTESLQNRFLEKGNQALLNKAVEAGLFESLGLKNPTIEPIEEQPVEETPTSPCPTLPPTKEVCSESQNIFNSDFIKSNILELMKEVSESLTILKDTLQSRMPIQEKVSGLNYEKNPLFARLRSVQSARVVLSYKEDTSNNSMQWSQNLFNQSLHMQKFRLSNHNTIIR